MKALLVVDVQNDFCPGGALPAPDGQKVVPVINNIIDKFDLVIASKDWHPGNSVHFDKWPVHCVRRTFGAEFHPELMKEKIDLVVYKGTSDIDNGYSAFEATNVSLSEYLKEKKIDELYITGLTTEYCVKNSVLDAIRYDFNTYLVTDAIRAVNANPGDHEKAIGEMEKAGVILIQSEDI
jgi:nicotinamidase/pyrazinamidase